MSIVEVKTRILDGGRVEIPSTGLTCQPIDRAILEVAANLRATIRLKTPDSIPAATALRHASSMFLTNDARAWDSASSPGREPVVRA